MAIKLNSKDLQSGSLNGKSLSEVWLNNQKIWPEEKVVIPTGDPVAFNINNVVSNSLIVRTEFEGAASDIIYGHKNKNITSYSGHELGARFDGTFNIRENTKVMEVRFDKATYGKVIFGDTSSDGITVSGSNINAHMYYEGEQDFLDENLDSEYSSIAVITFEPTIKNGVLQDSNIDFFIQFDLDWIDKSQTHPISSDFVIKAHIGNT